MWSPNGSEEISPTGALWSLWKTSWVTIWWPWHPRYTAFCGIFNWTWRPWEAWWWTSRRCGRRVFLGILLLKLWPANGFDPMKWHLGDENEPLEARIFLVKRLCEFSGLYFITVWPKNYYHRWEPQPQATGGWVFTCGHFTPIIHRDSAWWSSPSRHSPVGRHGFWASTLLASWVCCFACRIQDMSEFWAFAFEGSTNALYIASKNGQSGDFFWVTRSKEHSKARWFMGI